MRRKKQEITDKTVLDKILASAHICRLGFIDQDRPYVLPFNYGYHEGHIYIHCASEGKKIELIRKNNLVCFEVEDSVRIERYDKACKWSTTYRSIIGYGKVEILTEEAQKRQGMDVIMKQHGADDSIDRNYEKNLVDAMVILKIEITELSGKRSSNWIDENE